MEEKIILLRNHSKESKKAEQILQKEAIEHVELFLDPDEGGLPCLLAPDVAYRGLENIKSFVRSKKRPFKYEGK